MSILWRGKIGWGDVISPICYAARRNQPLTFFWPHGPHEWAADAARWIADHHQTEVDVRHLYRTVLHRDHVGYVDDGPMHNLGFTRLPRAPETDLVAVVTPRRNREPLPRAKRWKTPDTDWSALDAMGATEVDYRLPIAEAVDILLRAEVCVGYHGSASWLARWCGTPQVVVSDDPAGITSRSFSQAMVVGAMPSPEALPELMSAATERVAAYRRD